MQEVGNARCARQFVLTIIACILLFAAALKWHQLVTEPTAKRDLLTSRWLLLVIVELELFVAALVFADRQNVVSWYGAICTFTMFAAVTSYQIARGQRFCGCFGSLNVSPGTSLTVDVVAIAALWLTRPRTTLSGAMPNAKQGLSALVMFLPLGIPAAFGITTYSTASLSNDGSITGDSGPVFLEPDKWIGKPLPVAKYIDRGHLLGSGEWRVLIYNQNCPECRRVLLSYAALTDKLRGARVAILEVPPFGQSDNNIPYLRLKLDTTYDWFVKTPAELRLANGVVLEVEDEFDNYRRVTRTLN